MPLADEIQREVQKIFSDQWTTRSGQIVPEPENIKLGNEAVEFETPAILYADLTGSTALVDGRDWRFAAEIYKSYLYAAARIVRHMGGKITSYDGDRIMAMFIGDSPCTSATKAGLKINHAVLDIINPALKAQYPNSGYSIRQVVGIDTSPIRAARTGVRGGNDIVWIGRCANYAAKLTELKLAERTWITQAVFDRLHHSAKFADANQTPMWKGYKWSENGDKQIYGSTWKMSP